MSEKTPLEEKMDRDDRLIGKLGDVVNAIRHPGPHRDSGFTLMSALQEWGGMQRDYGFMGEIHRMQVETLAISLAGGAVVWGRMPKDDREEWRKAARAIGRGE